MRVLIADDEAIARDSLALSLSCIPEVDLVAVASNGSQALEMIEELKPDVALLDIKMPYQSGIGVLEALQRGRFVPQVIFVTAFRDHALSAIELDAVDYLLKPVVFERLREALRRAETRLRAHTADERFAELQRALASLQASQDEAGKPGYEKEMWLRNSQGLARVAVEQVKLFEAEGDYIVVHLTGSTYLIKDTMTALQQRLDPERFMRVHRSAIVNLSAVKQLKRRGPRRLSAVLDDGQAVDLGASYLDQVMEKLGAKLWRKS